MSEEFNLLKKNYYTPKQLAEKMSVPQSTIYSWIRLGKLSSVKFGGRVRILEEFVQEFIKKMAEQ